MVGRSWFVTEDSLLKHKQLGKQDSDIEKVKVPPVAVETKNDSVIVDRKNFISAKRASEISGYTCDYVGQLCRSGKLESTRVGNAWFVSEKSILSHCINLAQESSVIEKKIVQPVVIEKPVVVEKVIERVVEKIVPAVIQTPEKQKEIAVDHLKNKSSPSYLSYFTKVFLGFGVSLIIFALLFQALYKTDSVSKTTSVAPTASVLSSIPIHEGLAVVPSSGSVSQDEVIKKKIQDSFSDEVIVKPDKDGVSGIVKPVFKKANNQDFVYVMVPISKTQ